MNSHNKTGIIILKNDARTIFNIGGVYVNSQGIPPPKSDIFIVNKNNLDSRLKSDIELHSLYFVSVDR